MLNKRTDVISSKKTFGFEIELDAPSNNAIRDIDREYSGRGYRFVRDGSITGNYPIELVSPILSGESGAGSLIDICSNLKAKGFTSEHASMGVHVHIGGEAFIGKTKLAIIEDSGIESAYINQNGGLLNPVFISDEDYLKIRSVNSSRSTNDVINRFSRDVTSSVPIRIYRTMSQVLCGYLDSIKIGENEFVFVRLGFIDNTTLENEIHNNNTFKNDSEYQEHFTSLFKKDCGKFICEIENKASFQKLKTLFYFYTLYDNAFTALVSQSRRTGNSYCQPLADSYDLSQIESLKSHDELKLLWYKAKRIRELSYRFGDRYEDSRYHSFNLHSLFGRHGTIEIRSHGGTVEADKILLWLALHQYIVDKIDNGEITMEILEKCTPTPDQEGSIVSMLNVLNAPVHIEEYVKRLASFYSGIKLD